MNLYIPEYYIYANITVNVFFDLFCVVYIIVLAFEAYIHSDNECFKPTLSCNKYSGVGQIFTGIP